MKKIRFYISHKIKRMFQRVAIASQRKLINDRDNGRPQSPYATEAFSICKHFITREDSSLSMSPDGSKYIFNTAENVDIIIRNNLVEIILNKTYPYDVILHESLYLRLVRIFDNNVEIRRKKKEAEITSGVKYSLRTVLSEIQKKSKAK